MPQKLKNFVVLSTVFFSLFVFIKFVNALGSDDCTSKWRLVFHNVHQEKCYALAKPSCKKQEPQPAGYPKCLTQPNCIAEAKLIQVKGKECLDQTDLGCEATAIEENPSLNLCPKPACYTVLPTDSCQKDELAQSIKFIGQNDPRCQEGKRQPDNKGYCSCQAFSDEDLSLKSYLALSGGEPCDLTSSDTPLYIVPEIKTLTPFCQSHKINIQRVCRGAPKIDKVYLDGNPSVNYGPPGSEIIIEGLNLGNTIKVKVGDQPAEILSLGDHQVKVKIYKDPAGNNPHICANSVVLTTYSAQTRINNLLDGAISDIAIERSAVGYFIVASEKKSSAEIDKDSDSDGQRDETDNCPNDANANQIDNDQDNQGDVCDADLDDDSLLNLNDNCPYVQNSNQKNEEYPDSISGDVCETENGDLDADGDSIKDAVDNCPYVSNQNQNSSACADKPSNTPYYGRISFSPARGVFGSTLTLENDKKILGQKADRSWVTFAGDQELPAEFYDTEISYWQSDKIRVKTARGAKTEIEGKIRVHLCNPAEKRDVYLETDIDFKLIDPADATMAELSELKPKIAYFTPNFGVNRRQWQIEKDPYNLEYQEEVSLFGRNFDQVSNVSMIDKYGAELAVVFEVKSPYKIIVQLPKVNLPEQALELYFGQFKVCRELDCDLSKLRFYFQDYSPAAVRSPAIQEIKTLPAEADDFDFNPPYFYKLNQEVEIIGRNFGDQQDDSKVLFWGPAGYLEASGYSKWSNRAIKAIAPNKILSSEPEYKDFSSGALPILVCAAKYGCSSSLNYYPREKFEILTGDPNQSLVELGQPEIIPEIFHLNTSCAAVGKTVALRGYNFWDKQVDADEGINYYVSFQGEDETRIKAIIYPAWSAEAIQAVVPVGAKTGRVAVYRQDKNSAEEKIGFSDEILSINSSCAASSGYCFSGNQLPEIYKIEPAQEYVGLNKEGATIGAQEKVITIYGCNLGKDIGSSYALFNDIKHNQILSWNSYEVKTLAPFDVAGGKASLYIWDGFLGYQTNELNFQVKPAVQKVLPNRGSANQIIAILGSDFCQADSCLKLPEVYLSFYQDLGLAGVKANQLLGFNRRQIQFKLDRGAEDDYDIIEANGGKIDAKSAVYSGLLYVKRADGVLSRPYQTETRGHFGYFFERAPNFFTKLPLLKDIAPNTVFAKQDTKILLKGENFYGTANIPAEFQNYAYGSYPKTKIWNYFLENLNLETKEDYLVKQGVSPTFNQSLEIQELVATYILSPFTQKSGIINRHSLLGINYDGSFGLFFKSGAPRLDLRSIASYEADDELIQINTGRSYYGYWSYGRQQLAKVNLQASSVIPFELKIKNPDFSREDSAEKAEIEFKINKEWFQKIYKDDRISITQTLPAINQLGIFDISAVVDQASGQVDFDFSFYNGIERYYQCNYLEAPVGEEKIIVCNSEPYFPGVLPRGQSALASYGFFQTNQFVVDCAPPKIKNIAVVSSSKIKVSGENLNNVSVTINGKGYKSGYSNGSLSVPLSKKLSPGGYVLRAQSKDRCATYPKYDENNFKIY